MKVLSFDIGMKHLAFCKIEYIDNKFNILHWQCVNVINEDKENDPNEHLYKCLHIMKTKTVCNKTSSIKRIFMGDDHEINELPLCKTHHKMHLKNFPNDSYKNIKKPKKIKISKLNIHFLSKQLAKSLDKLNDDIFDVDYILLENQPRFNIRMKCFAAMLFQYCTMRTINNENLEQIIYVHPKDALKIYDGPKLENKSKNKYKNKKDNSIFVTKYLLREEEEWLKFLDEQKTKLDDLCDAFLNGAFYIKNN